MYYVPPDMIMITFTKAARNQLGCFIFIIQVKNSAYHQILLASSCRSVDFLKSIQGPRLRIPAWDFQIKPYEKYGFNLDWNFIIEFRAQLSSSGTSICVLVLFLKTLREKNLLTWFWCSGLQMRVGFKYLSVGTYHNLKIWIKWVIFHFILDFTPQKSV